MWYHSSSTSTPICNRSNTCHPVNDARIPNRNMRAHSSVVNMHSAQFLPPRSGEDLQSRSISTQGIRIYRLNQSPQQLWKGFHQTNSTRRFRFNSLIEPTCRQASTVCNGLWGIKLVSIKVARPRIGPSGVFSKVLSYNVRACKYFKLLYCIKLF